jgi:ABC-type transport system involved in multi-copper enzyme maturation permease subunit
MRATLRLTFKTLRFEIVAMVLAILVIGGAAALVAWRIDAVGMPVDCLYGGQNFGGGFAIPVQGTQTDQAHEAACQAKRQEFYDLVNSGSQVFALGVLIPAVTGLLVGVPLVARELETGSASLAWTLSRSRRRWYYRRAVPLALFTLLVLVVPAITTIVLERASQPAFDPLVSFSDAFVRGPIVAMRGLAALAIGILIGAIVGRQLPSVIVGGLVVVLVLAVEGMAMSTFLRSQAEWLPVTSVTEGADYTLDSAYRDKATGEIVDNGTIYSLAPLDANGNPDSAWLDARYSYVILATRGIRYPLFMLVETILLGAVGGGAIVLGGLVVDRRRPA